ncbi:histidine kinase [Burkholderiales bacterium JOSHI_001]|nr:histidine kinase [Burkholderiales bacterium JOSHI_001]
MATEAPTGLPPELAALLAHDLKNELGALEATLELLASEVPAARARSGHQQCRALRQRFVMFLTLYGAQGHLAACCEDESPANLLLALHARHLQPDDAQAVPVQLDPRSDPPPFAYFDPRLVSLALEAALHNAQRFAATQVLLGVRHEQRHLVFWVADDGPGLGAAAAHQGAKPLNTGLGTELCRAVARAHRHGLRAGEVKLFNRPEGGAQFELWLP